MKKSLAILLSALMLAALLTGCSGKKEEAAAEPAKNLWKSENEILTYEKLDPDKTTIVVSRSGNTYIDEFSEEFEKQNPDVQVVCLDITGGNDKVKPVAEWVKHGQAPDIMFASSGTFTDEETIEYFENLSASPVIDSYSSQALNREAVDANIYWLPGPSTINCMVYNKTLFERYGWQVPTTFDEFVALCVQIKADTNGEVEPWNPNAKYSNEFLTATEAFVYNELFSGLENRTWYNNLTEKKATLAGHIEPYYEAMQTLIDNGILKEEFYSYSATTRGKEFAAGKIAMINYPVSNLDSEQFDFDYMPFPTTSEDVGYLCDYFSCLVGVPKKEHSDAERDAIDRYIAYFSSVEGQKCFIGNSLTVSNLKDVGLGDNEDMKSLDESISHGHLFSLLRFESKSFGAANFSFHNDVLSMIKGEKTAAECIAQNDAMLYKAADEQKSDEPTVVATAKEDFTILETSEYFADFYREKAGADIGLINNNIAFRGNLMKIFAGELTDSDVVTLKPRSFDNASTLIKVSMTGEQLIAALNDPMGNNEESTNSIYAYSGLYAEVAPFNPIGEKYLKLTLADGSEIEKDKLYTVALWSGTVYDKYITETLESFEGSFETLLTEKLTADGTITPPSDGRIKLTW